MVWGVLEGTNRGAQVDTVKTDNSATAFVHQTLPVGNHAVFGQICDRDIVYTHVDLMVGYPHDPSDVIFQRQTSPITSLKSGFGLGGRGGYEQGARS